ncbi:HepT-like ribonuclease domain-containing protein, partial [Deinococcus aerolatus]|uniref:HepT-like ribonuclease domain-containing protein n=1 Tax=Deinococcus aerolatus TaxID=522487 RepID=UPI00166CA639
MRDYDDIQKYRLQLAALMEERHIGRILMKSVLRPDLELADRIVLNLDYQAGHSITLLEIAQDEADIAELYGETAEELFADAFGTTGGVAFIDPTHGLQLAGMGGGPPVFGTRLADMLEAIDRLEEYADALDRDSFCKDPTGAVADAIRWQMTVLGEAARTIPDHLRSEYDAIPFKALCGLRDVWSEPITPDQWSSTSKRNDSGRR